MAHANETQHGPETHCEPCAKDQRRADILHAAADIVAVEDKDLEGYQRVRESAVKILQKAFDEELLPKGLM